MMEERELQRIEDIAVHSMYSYGVNSQAVRYSMTLFNRYAKSGSVLELGPAEGIGTRCLVKRYSDLTVVEGSHLFCQKLKKEFSNIEVVHSLFEEFSPTREFDNIILGHVLEHVQDPTKLLKKVANWLAPDGKIFCAVPNSRSIHRQAAVIMGMLHFEKDLNEADIRHGHRRIYDPESLRSEFLKTGYKIEFFGGYWLKPLSNTQIEDTWTEEMVSAFFALGERYPDIAAEIYVVATK